MYCRKCFDTTVQNLLKKDPSHKAALERINANWLRAPIVTFWIMVVLLLITIFAEEPERQVNREHRSTAITVVSFFVGGAFLMFACARGVTMVCDISYLDLNFISTQMAIHFFNVTLIGAAAIAPICIVAQNNGARYDPNLFGMYTAWSALVVLLTLTPLIVSAVLILLSVVPALFCCATLNTFVLKFTHAFHKHQYFALLRLFTGMEHTDYVLWPKAGRNLLKVQKEQHFLHEAEDDVKGS